MSKMNAFLYICELSVQIFHPFFYWIICLPVLYMFLWVVLWVFLALACLFFSWYFECVCSQIYHICIYVCTCIYISPYFLHGFWVCVLEKDSSLLYWNFFIFIYSSTLIVSSIYIHTFWSIFICPYVSCMVTQMLQYHLLNNSSFSHWLEL